jgi:acetolactate synthase I/II/III large subunit
MDLLPYDHSLNMGRPGVVASRASNFTIQNCDLLISVGSSLDNIITAFNPLDFAREAKKIIVDIDENEIKNNPMEINTSVISDAKKFFEELNSLGNSKEKYIAWLRICRDWKLRYGINQNRVENNSLNINHYELINTLSEIIPKNSLIATGSSGLAIEIFYTSFMNKVNQRIFLTSGIGAMGYGISSAIGACIGIGKKRTICIESDGSIMLNIQELATLKSYNLPIIIIILNNKGYASIRNTQQNYFNGRFIGTAEDSGLKIPEFTKIAKSYNINSRKITSIKSLKSIFSKIKKINEPLILDVILDKNEILAPKVSAITKPDGSIVSMPLEDMSPLLPLKVLQEEMLIPLLESSLNANRNEK